MKNLFYLSFVLLIFASCTDYKKQIEDLKTGNDSLVRANLKRDSTLNGFLSAFNEIEGNLSQIKQKERMLSVESTKGIENSAQIKDRINSDILQIYELLQSNRQKLNDIQKKLNRSNFKIDELNKIIKRLELQLQEKDSTIMGLRNTLKAKDLIIDSLYVSIDSMFFYSEVKDEIISDQDEKLNTAYYVIGSKKELIENEILDRKGGFVGINRIIQLKNDFNKDYFTKININNVVDFPLFAKKVEIITPHASSSYTLVETEQVDSLKITNPKEFWEASKYLVVVTD